MEEKRIDELSIQFDDGDIYIRQFEDCILLSNSQAKEIIKILTEFVSL